MESEYKNNFLLKFKNQKYTIFYILYLGFEIDYNYKID